MSRTRERDDVERADEMIHRHHNLAEIFTEIIDRNHICGVELVTCLAATSEIHNRIESFQQRRRYGDEVLVTIDVLSVLPLVGSLGHMQFIHEHAVSNQYKCELASV